ncbi:syntaxin-16 [Trichinella spiralis]|uniref:Syntaxin-16 n=1 Tax=Trichinella spiralis TaxID=6334 RepID=E5SGJ0_TRISP|nr:syntaxin-16 [Trichinella spiralis]KRY41603.1 Syntaxin-16 [Trichinella spiralis]
MGHLENFPRLGIVRSLTDIYITLRNNAVQSRHIFHDNVSRKSEDRMTLIPLHDSSVETSIPMSDFREPPEWIHIVDEIQFEMSKISTQINELKSLQQRHVSRPSFSDEISQEEQNIENLTGEITHQLNHVQSLLQLVTRSRSEGTAERFRANVVLAHVQALQTLTSDFQRSQSEYLRQIQSRESSYQKYFESYISSDVGDICLPDFQNADIGDLATASSATTTGAEPTMSELQLLEQSTVLVKEREREIMHVTRSIVELNQLFRDLATYISDQGTVLDRIDYNVEKSAPPCASCSSSSWPLSSLHLSYTVAPCALVLHTASRSAASIPCSLCHRHNNPKNTNTSAFVIYANILDLNYPAFRQLLLESSSVLNQSFSQEQWMLLIYF